MLVVVVAFVLREGGREGGRERKVRDGFSESGAEGVLVVIIFAVFVLREGGRERGREGGWGKGKWCFSTCVCVSLT